MAVSLGRGRKNGGSDGVVGLQVEQGCLQVAAKLLGVAQGLGVEQRELDEEQLGRPAWSMAVASWS